MSKTDATTILIYGRSRAGKTAQLGEMAEMVMKTTGKKSRIYTIDRGGYGVIAPHVEIGLIEVVEQDGLDPFIFLNKAVTGQVRDGKGGWIPGDLSNIGMVAFEGMTAFADAMMTKLAEKSAQGVNIGGQSSVAITFQDGNESVKVGGNNMSHYNIVQTRITDEVWRSQGLPTNYVVWTASVSKDDDQVSSNKVLGPAVVGKALTSEVPRWFQYTFRIDAVPAQQGKSERHILYLGLSTDLQAGNAISLGNTRVPMGAADLPPTIEPASLVQALTMITKGSQQAKENLQKRLAAK